MNCTIEFCIFKLVLVLNFSLNEQLRFFWTKFTQKGYFQSKTDKMTCTTELCIFKLVIFQSKQTILFFWTKFAQNG